MSGWSKDTVRRREQYRASAAARKVTRKSVNAGDRILSHPTIDRAMTPVEWDAYREVQAVPSEDNRTITARLMGDPPLERSALGKGQ